MCGWNDHWRTHNAGRVLFSAADLFAREKLRLVHAGGFPQVSEVQMSLVQNLDPGGTRLTEIAARARMTKQSMRELVDKASVLGLVSRRSDPDDGRAKIVMFTPTGLAMLDRLGKGVLQAECQMAAATRPGFVDELKTQLGIYLACEAPTLCLTEDRAWRRRNVGRLLFSAADLFTRQTLQTVRASEFHAVSAVQLALFRNLDLDGTRLTKIARRARMTKQAMLELVDKAESMGLVERLPDAGDRRAKMVVFTPVGLRMLGCVQQGVEVAGRLMAGKAGTGFVEEMIVQLSGYISQGSTKSDRVAA